MLVCLMETTEEGVKVAASKMYDEAATRVKKELLMVQLCLIRCWFVWWRSWKKVWGWSHPECMMKPLPMWWRNYGWRRCVLLDAGLCDGDHRRRCEGGRIPNVRWSSYPCEKRTACRVPIDNLTLGNELCCFILAECLCVHKNGITTYIRREKLSGGGAFIAMQHKIS